jgi:SAM-dependent methyltransferase
MATAAAAERTDALWETGGGQHWTKIVVDLRHTSRGAGDRGMTTGQAHGELWSGGARDWATYMEPSFRPFYDAVHDRLAIGNGTRLLDVGCGPGGSALLAAGRGARVAGLDASPGSVELARERIPEGDLRVGEMESLPWPDGSFDAVTGFNSFQFAGNPTAALREARRVLAPGGKVGMAIWTPPEESQLPRIMAAINALAPPQPMDGPGPFALSGPGVAKSVLESAGLRAVDRGEVPVVSEFPDAEAACRAMMAGSSGARAIAHSGEQRVRQAILEALEEFRLETGGYRIENRFRFLIAE